MLFSLTLSDLEWLSDILVTRSIETLSFLWTLDKASRCYIFVFWHFKAWTERSESLAVNNTTNGVLERRSCLNDCETFPVWRHHVTSDVRQAGAQQCHAISDRVWSVVHLASPELTAVTANVVRASQRLTGMTKHRSVLSGVPRRPRDHPRRSSVYTVQWRFNCVGRRRSPAQITSRNVGDTRTDQWSARPSVCPVLTL